jgi:iron complex transport system ATP-binding protein
VTGLDVLGADVGYRRRRATTTVLAGVTLRAAPGELTALLGPNGAGKSTLLRTIAGLQPPLAGAIRLGGADLVALAPEQRARRVAVVLTERVEAGLLTAWELAALGRHPHTGPRGALRAADRAAVRAALVSVGAEHLAARPVGELSDGERQRVLIARALAQRPQLLLLDEPTAFLDAPSRVSVTGLLRRLARERHIVVVTSTHDVDLALRVADHGWLLDRERRLRAGSPAELVARGAVGAAFDSAELRFDAAAGTFVMRSTGL